MKRIVRFVLAGWWIVLLCAACLATDTEEFLISPGTAGRYGGRLVVAQRAEAKTLNPVTALDRPSREVIGRLQADLIHINRNTQHTEAALAKSWQVSNDGREYVVHLRRGIQFSDGQPFDADDVLFSFRVYLDEKLNSPQRDLLMIGGKAIVVEKIDGSTLRMRLPAPYAAAERIFDSIAMLPRHLLEKQYDEGKLGNAWPLSVAPDQIAGLGPFRLKKYVPGQALALEKNPYYWKRDIKGQRLPYLEELTFLPVSSEDAETLRFEAGDTDVLNRISAQNFQQVSKDGAQKGADNKDTLLDLGPGLEYNFLLLNMNDDTAERLPEIGRKQAWFRQLAFRRALSLAIDRAGIVRLVYEGRGVPLWSQVTPGNQLWRNVTLPQPPQSVEQSRELLKKAGFVWKQDGVLSDASGQTVEFTIITSSSNAQRTQIANIIQQDLAKLGMQVHVVPLEFRSFVQRVTQSHDYEAAMMGLVTGDVDPNGDMNVWTSDGATHLWNLGEKQPATPWEAEMDSLMHKQLTTLDFKARKKMYDRVQQIVAEQLPVICLVSPNILVGARKQLQNFQPAILEHYTLHNVDELYWSPK
jgi:peptide/nickel transport system substrate-binding protein